MSHHVCLEDVFSDLEDYVVIKSHTLPSYKTGTDIDIVVKDKSVIDIIIGRSLKALPPDFTLVIKPKSGKVHVDFMYKDKLSLKLDLYLKLHPLINADMISKILETRKPYRGFYVASVEHDIIVRAVEYILYNHKTHHLKFIKDSIVPNIDELLKKSTSLQPQQIKKFV